MAVLHDLSCITFYEVGGIEEAQLEGFVLPLGGIGSGVLAALAERVSAAVNRNAITSASSEGQGHLLALPADAIFGVFDEDAFGEQVVADGVGAGEVAGLLGLGAFGDESVDVGVGERKSCDERGVGLVEAAFGFGPGERGAGDGGVVIFEDGEDSVEEGEDA